VAVHEAVHDRHDVYDRHDVWRVERMLLTAAALIFAVSFMFLVMWLAMSEQKTKLTRQAVNYIIRQAGERAGLDRVNPHMLRHSCGYALANMGKDTRLIQDYLGHRDPRHTVRYTQTSAKRFASIWDKKPGGPQT